MAAFNFPSTSASITKHTIFQTLRQSFAIHLLEGRINVPYSQDLRGHDGIETTQRYTHITQNATGRFKSPLATMQI